MVAAGFAATGLLLSYATPLQLVGGILIALLGIQSVRSFLKGTPDVSVAKAPIETTILPAYVTTFALTESNPMTIRAFVGLVAGLGASASSDPKAPYWLVAGCFWNPPCGSCFW